MKRFITGIVAVSAWLFLLTTGPFLLFWLAITFLAAVALAEYLAIVLPAGDRQHKPLLVVFGLLPLIGSCTGQPFMVLAGLIAALTALLLFAVLGHTRLSAPYELISRSGFGYLAVSLCSAHVVLLMAMPQGRAWLLLLTAVTAASDTAAFYTGTLFGRRKLCPAISPGKTWEGFLGGLAGGLLAALLVRIFFLPGQGIPWIIGIALLLGCLGVVGDLAESMVKRAFTVKDSGTILPGHGGLLDRIDSLLLTAPVLYYLLSFP